MESTCDRHRTAIASLEPRDARNHWHWQGYVFTSSFIYDHREHKFKGKEAPKFSFVLLLCVCECSAYKCVCAPQAGLVPRNIRRRGWTLWSWSHTRVLETETGSSTGASALICWAIFPESSTRHQNQHSGTNSNSLFLSSVRGGTQSLVCRPELYLLQRSPPSPSPTSEWYSHRPIIHLFTEYARSAGQRGQSRQVPQCSLASRCSSVPIYDKSWHGRAEALLTANVSKHPLSFTWAAAGLISVWIAGWDSFFPLSNFLTHE